MTRRRKLLFATAAILLSVVATLTALLAVDIHLHHKFAKAAGLNVWGYRGEPVGRKRPHEIRVVVLGGSTVLGFGLDEPEAFPFMLGELLNRAATAPTTYSVVNLGYNQAGAYSFRYTLEDYKYLDYDIVCLYEGYNDLGALHNRLVSRRDWFIFRLTGYMPMLPIVMTEKITQLRYGDVRGTRPDVPVFRPGIVSRTKADLLDAAKKINDSLDRQLRNVKNTETDSTGLPPVPECSPRWAFYCGGVAAGVDYARQLRKPVMVITQPYGGGGHPEQQAQMQEMLAHRYSRDPAVRYVNLGHTVDMRDPTMCWDSMHLTKTGNERIAQALLPEVQKTAASLVQ